MGNKPLERLLLERYIFTQIKDINIPISYEFTNHSLERKFRHIKSNGKGLITNKEIIKTIDCALPKLIKYVYFDKLLLDNEIRIFNKKTSLNIIVQLTKLNNNIGIKIITVMRKENFTPKKGTYTITINCII